MTEPKNKCAGAICGGSRKAAERYVKKEGHCKNHKRFRKRCEACLDRKIEIIDEVFMALMQGSSENIE